MRWKKQPHPSPGDTRMMTAFLLWPKNINNDVRWLERATWEEKYECGYDWCQFKPVRWIDNG